MALADRIETDLRMAIKQREAGRARLLVLRQIKSAAKYEEVRLGRPLAEDEWLAVLGREVRQREEVRPDLVRSGREDVVAKLDEELRLVREYLPAQLSQEQLQAEVARAAAEMGASSKADLGRMMGVLVPRLRGQVDGSVLRQAVERHLSR